MDRLPIIYVPGYAGPTSGIDTQVDDPFYGFNKRATHVRVGGSGNPMFYEFEGPILPLMIDESYQVLVHGDQHAFLVDAQLESLPPATLWVYRFLRSGGPAWLAQYSQVNGPIAAFDPITNGLAEMERHPAELARDDHQWECRVNLPEAALELPILGSSARLTITITERVTQFLPPASPGLPGKASPTHRPPGA